MRKSALILSVATVALGTTGAIGWFLAAPNYATKRIIGFTARQVSETDWTLNCLGSECKDAARKICGGFTVVSEELDYGSRWHTTIKCAS